jgi:hypothetical protein
MNVSSESDKWVKDAMLKKMKDLWTEIENKKKEAEKLIKEVKKEEKKIPKSIKKSTANVAKSWVDALYIK